MARAATTADVFNAVAEPARRLILDTLARASSALTVSALVDALRIPQPAVSKHLAVLRAVGLVSAVPRGRHREYALNARELKAVHDWVKTYERFWSHQLDSIKARAERAARGQPARTNTRTTTHKDPRP